MQLTRDNVFLDLGHGIGNTCLQAAFTIGCKAKGVELVEARYFASEAAHRAIAKVANRKSQNEVRVSHRDESDQLEMSF